VEKRGLGASQRAWGVRVRSGKVACVAPNKATEKKMGKGELPEGAVTDKTLFKKKCKWAGSEGRNVTQLKGTDSGNGKSSNAIPIKEG